MRHVKTKYLSHLTQDSLLHILRHLYLVIKRINISYETQQLQMKYAVTVSIYVKIWIWGSYYKT